MATRAPNRNLLEITIGRKRFLFDPFNERHIKRVCAGVADGKFDEQSLEKLREIVNQANFRRFLGGEHQGSFRDKRATFIGAVTAYVNAGLLTEEKLIDIVGMTPLEAYVYGDYVGLDQDNKFSEPIIGSTGGFEFLRELEKVGAPAVLDAIAKRRKLFADNLSQTLGADLEFDFQTGRRIDRPTAKVSEVPVRS